MITRTLLAISAATFCSTSLAESENSEGEWSWGIGVFGSPDIYRDASPRTIPVPIIAYNTERLHVFGPFVAYDVYQSEHLTGAVRLKPVFAGYNESDSPYFEGMDDRHWSMAGGAGLEYTKSFLKLRLDADHDLLGINNGYESKAGISFRFPVNGVLIEPGLAAQYQSRAAHQLSRRQREKDFFIDGAIRCVGGSPVSGFRIFNAKVIIHVIAALILRG